MENEKILLAEKLDIIVPAISGVVVFPYFLGADVDAPDFMALIKSILLPIAVSAAVVTHWFRKRRFR